MNYAIRTGRMDVLVVTVVCITYIGFGIVNGMIGIFSQAFTEFKQLDSNQPDPTRHSTRYPQEMTAIPPIANAEVNRLDAIEARLRAMESALNRISEKRMRKLRLKWKNIVLYVSQSRK